MAYIRKTVDEYYIESNYGYGWGLECYAEDRQDAQRLLKEYRENMGKSAQFRSRKRRIRKEDAM